MDLLNNRVEGEDWHRVFRRANVRHRVTAAKLILGDMSTQGNINAARSVTEPLLVAMDMHVH